MATRAAKDWRSMKLKIYVDKKKKRVVFAEAKKDFVDFIFHILSLPLGTVQRILSNTPSILGSLGTLQQGLKNLDDQYLEKPAKDYLLSLKAPYWGGNTTRLLPDASWYKAIEFKQSQMKQTVELARDFYCLSLTEKVNVVGSELDKALACGNEKGYVKEAAMFMVMDNLVVRPAESDTFISLMNEHSIKDVGAIEKRVVTFGTSEAIKLLKASISSNTVLTDVLLGVTVKAEN